MSVLDHLRIPTRLRNVDAHMFILSFPVNSIGGFCVTNPVSWSTIGVPHFVKVILLENAGAPDSIFIFRFKVDANRAAPIPIESVCRLRILDVVVMLRLSIVHFPALPRNVPHLPNTTFIQDTSMTR